MLTLMPGPCDQTLRWLSTFPGCFCRTSAHIRGIRSTYRSHEKRRRPPACRFTWIRNALSRIGELPHRRSPEHEVIRGHDDRTGPLQLGKAVDVGKYDGSANPPGPRERGVQNLRKASGRAPRQCTCTAAASHPQERTVGTASCLSRSAAHTAEALSGPRAEHRTRPTRSLDRSVPPGS